jgi:hypothetical protein
MVEVVVEHLVLPGGDVQRGVQVLVVVGVEHHGVRLPA